MEYAGDGCRKGIDWSRRQDARYLKNTQGGSRGRVQCVSAWRNGVVTKGRELGRCRLLSDERSKLRSDKHTHESEVSFEFGEERKKAKISFAMA